MPSEVINLKYNTEHMQFMIWYTKFRYKQDACIFVHLVHVQLNFVEGVPN